MPHQVKAQRRQRQRAWPVEPKFQHGGVATAVTLCVTPHQRTALQRRMNARPADRINGRQDPRGACPFISERGFGLPLICNKSEAFISDASFARTHIWPQRACPSGASARTDHRPAFLSEISLAWPSTPARILARSTWPARIASDDSLAPWRDRVIVMRGASSASSARNSPAGSTRSIAACEREAALLRAGSNRCWRCKAPPARRR